jgi:cyclophilin family peptidyl-prolyl cis-trans isomerase
MAKQWSTQPDLIIDAAKQYRATIRTSLGDITVELFADRSPTTVNNFVFLAAEGFYDGVIFHRVINGFMIQGGDPTGTGTGGPGYRFRDELDAAKEFGYAPGILAMANAGPNTNGSQFFLMHRDNPLPPAYAVFGRTVEGLEVINSIATTPTGPGDRPLTEVIIHGVDVVESADA